MSSSIYFSVQGDGPAVVLLHGLFGSGSNLGALARSLREDYRVYSVDLPNHGRSAWLDSMELSELAGRIGQWLEEQGLADAAFVGHSLGGKVAMRLALDTPERVAALVVADIAPVDYPPHHDEVFAALEAVEQAGVESRAEASTLMQQHLQEPGVIQFLLASLQRGDDGRYRWRFNIDAIRRDYGAVRTALAGPAFRGPVLFVKGAESDYIVPEHREQILALFPSAEVKVMPGCGHWLHAEQPRLFNAIVGRFLAAQYPAAGG